MYYAFLVPALVLLIASFALMRLVFKGQLFVGFSKMEARLIDRISIFSVAIILFVFSFYFILRFYGVKL